MPELIERKPDGGQVAFLDCPVFIAVERFAQDLVRFALHLRQIFRRLCLSRLGDQPEVSDAEIEDEIVSCCLDQ